MKLSLLSFATIFCFSSCTILLETVVGELVKVDKKIYETLAANKSAVEEVGIASKDLFNVTSTEQSFTKLKSLYADAQKDHNDLVKEISKDILKKDSLKIDDYQSRLTSVNSKITALKDHLRSLTPSMSGIDWKTLAAEAAVAILKSLARETVLKAYIKTFVAKYSIVDYNLLPDATE